MNERIGPYILERRIGLGGMGVVYAAHDEALQRRVALKVISPQFADDAEFRARFVREARAMAALSSPHVVSVYAHGETDGQLWMATQYFPGGDLGTLLRRSGPSPVLDAIELMAQIADGLGAAHAAGLVHRDIKPANVLLRRSGMRWTAALADFGIARAGADQTGLTQGGMVGTPSFMAPELHTGGEASVASDLYSTGCLIWTTVAGSAPYPGVTDYEVVSAHLEQPIPQLEGDTALVAGLNSVLRRAMAKDPAERYRDAASLRDDLRGLARSVASGPTVVRRAAAATPPPVAPPADSQTRSRRRLLALAMAALPSVLGVAAAVLLWPESPQANEVSAPSETTSARQDTETSEPEETEPEEMNGADDGVPTSGASSTPQPGPDGFTEAEREKATASFVEALGTQPTITPSSAQCLAEEILAGEGLAEMVEARFFDADWAYVDQDLEPHPDIKSRFTIATFACVAG